MGTFCVLLKDKAARGEGRAPPFICCARIPFSNEGRIRQRREMDGLRLSFAVHKIQSLTPLPHMAISLFQTFTFTLFDVSG